MSDMEKAKIYNTDRADTDLEHYSDAVMNGPKKKTLSPLVWSAGALALLILGVVLYWAARVAGIF